MGRAKSRARGWDLRVLVDELGAVVDGIVDDDVDVLLGVVLSNVLVGELLEVRHFDCWGFCLIGIGSGYILQTRRWSSGAGDEQEEGQITCMGRGKRNNPDKIAVDKW